MKVSYDVDVVKLTIRSNYVNFEVIQPEWHEGEELQFGAPEILDFEKRPTFGKKSKSFGVSENLAKYLLGLNFILYFMQSLI